MKTQPKTIYNLVPETEYSFKAAAITIGNYGEYSDEEQTFKTANYVSTDIDPTSFIKLEKFKFDHSICLQATVLLNNVDVFDDKLEVFEDGSNMQLYANSLIESNIPPILLFDKKVLPVRIEEYFLEKAEKFSETNFPRYTVRLTVVVDSIIDKYEKSHLLAEKLARGIKTVVDSGMSWGYNFVFKPCDNCVWETKNTCDNMNSKCLNQESHPGYFCQCLTGYESIRNRCVPIGEISQIEMPVASQAPVMCMGESLNLVFLIYDFPQSTFYQITQFMITMFSNLPLETTNIQVFTYGNGLQEIIPFGNHELVFFTTVFKKTVEELTIKNRNNKRNGNPDTKMALSEAIFNVFTDSTELSNSIIFTNGDLGKGGNTPAAIGRQLFDNSQEIDIFLMESEKEVQLSNFNTFLQAVGPEVRIHRPSSAQEMVHSGGQFLASYCPSVPCMSLVEPVDLIFLIDVSKKVKMIDQYYTSVLEAILKISATTVIHPKLTRISIVVYSRTAEIVFPLNAAGSFDELYNTVQSISRSTPDLPSRPLLEKALLFLKKFVFLSEKGFRGPELNTKVKVIAFVGGSTNAADLAVSGARELKKLFGMEIMIVNTFQSDSNQLDELNQIAGETGQVINVPLENAAMMANRADMIFSAIWNYLPGFVGFCGSASDSLPPNWIRLKEQEFKNDGKSTENEYSVEVSWQNMVDVSGYQLMMFETPENEQVYNEIINPEQTSSLVTGLQPGKQYYAKIASRRIDPTESSLNNLQESPGNFTDNYYYWTKPGDISRTTSNVSISLPDVDEFTPAGVFKIQLKFGNEQMVNFYQVAVFDESVQNSGAIEQLTRYIKLEDIQPFPDGKVDHTFEVPLEQNKNYKLSITAIVGTRTSEPANFEFKTGNLKIPRIRVIRAFETTTTTTNFQWTEINSALNYLIEVFDFNTKEEIQRETVFNNNFLVENLLPGTKYESRITVTGKNGQQSEPTSQTFYTIPIRPKSLEANKISENSISIILEPVPNGNAEVYVVELLDIEKGAVVVDITEIQVESHSSGGKFQVVFDNNLNPGKNYMISVYSRSGDQKSANKQLDVRTLQSPPGEVRITKIGNNGFKVGWEALKGENRYQVCVEEYKKLMNSKKITITEDCTSEVFETLKSNFQVDKLEPGGGYIVRVSSAFRGRYSEPIMINTKPMTIESDSVKKSTVGSSFVELQWSPAEGASGYKIEVLDENNLKIQEKNIHSDFSEQNKEKPSVVVLLNEGLKSGYSYTAVLTPISAQRLDEQEGLDTSNSDRFGESIRVSFTLEPPMYPTGIEIVEKSSDSIKIRWNEPRDHVEEFSVITQVENELPNVNTFRAENGDNAIVTDYTISDLLPGKNYFLQVSAGSNRKVRQATPVTQVFTCKYKFEKKIMFYVSHFKVSLKVSFMFFVSCCMIIFREWLEKNNSKFHYRSIFQFSCFPTIFYCRNHLETRQFNPSPHP